jgi:PBP1b-binding outer membrane lipoprotein LpoB
MKKLIALATAGLLLASGCSRDTAAKSADSAAGAQATTEHSVDDLPTPEEEAAKAAKTIDAENADAELSKLQSELEQD